MAATMSALRVVAPVARVSASKARVARSAVAAKVSLRGPFFHLDRDGCESPPIGAVIPPRPPRAWTHRTVPSAQPVKARSVVVRASSGDVSERLEDALKVRRAPRLPRAAAEILSPMP